MANDYQRMCSLDNLNRAYRWVQSNPDALYKKFFRDSYSAYAASSQYNLNRLRKHLLRYAFEGTHASKLYFPKPSGILRPYTLLAVDDQIVYQACVNIIAEKLKSQVQARYYKNIFGHLYAGKSSKFFYYKWQDGYRLYSRAVVENIKKGFDYVANFDLTSFYDSIDHSVLQHFLIEIDIDKELIDFLFRLLKLWTSSTWTNRSNIIYIEHGIPQGPLSSGLLSEVILKHIDDKGIRFPEKNKKVVKYLRYVDDIKLFAKNEKLLRQRLISLDLAAKEIGLFPQSLKINVRKVTNPIEEIKTVSGVAELVSNPAINQNKMYNQILDLSKGGKIRNEDQTKFKYLLSRTIPNYKLNNRIIQILKNHPSLSTHIAYYFGKYKKLPPKCAEKIVHFIRNEDIFHSVQADILFATIENMPEPYKAYCLGYCNERLFPTARFTAQPQPSLKAALLAWILKNDNITYQKLKIFITEELDWWVIKDVLKYIRDDQYGIASYNTFLNEQIESKYADIARMAALKIINENLNVNSKSANEAAKLLLFSAGKIRKIGKPESLVSKVLCYVLKCNLPPFSWDRLFGQNHKKAEYIAFNVKKDFESNINSCLLTLDSLCDLLFEKLFNKFLPQNTYGNYGSMLLNPTINQNLPNTCSAFQELHKLRLLSITAHPRSRSGNSTRHLKYGDFYNIKPHLISAFNEIAQNITV